MTLKDQTEENCEFFTFTINQNNIQDRLTPNDLTLLNKKRLLNEDFELDQNMLLENSDKSEEISIINYFPNIIQVNKRESIDAENNGKDIICFVKNDKNQQKKVFKSHLSLKKKPSHYFKRVNIRKQKKK